MGFGILNYVVLGLYLISTVGIGVYFSKRSGKDTDNFFKAGGRVPGWAVGVSIFATTLSAITFMSIPAKAFRTDWAFMGNNFAIIAITPIVITFFVPFFRKLKVTTAYEYLEHRFDFKTRSLSSIIFMLFHIGRIAIVIYLPTLAIASVSNINPYIIVLAIGILCIISTFLGGVEGVIWCDVVQGFLLMGGALFIIFFGVFKINGNITEIVNVSIEQGKFLTASTSGFSFWKETLITCFICGLFNNMYQYIGSQDVVQRYNSTSSTQETNKSLWINAKLAFLVIIMFYGMGTVLYVFYKQNPSLLPVNFNIDSVVPFFIIHEMPAGLAGLLVAAIFAAAQSTISSSLNSISACYVTDFQRRLKPSVTEKHSVMTARWVIIICGLFGTIAAAYMVATDKSQLLNAFNALLGMFGGPIAGIFLLGIFTKRSNGSGAFLGAFLSVIVEVLLSRTNIYFMYYGMAGVAVSFVCGYFLSFMFKHSKNVGGLTYSTVNEEIAHQ